MLQSFRSSSEKSMRVFVSIALVFGCFASYFVSNAVAAGGRRRGGGQSYSTPAMNASYRMTPSGDTSAAEFLRYANYARSLSGAGPLVEDANLMSLAQSHSSRMASGGGFAHSSYGMHENIGMGQNSSREIYESWWNSSGHRQNMLGRQFTRVGVAYVNGYWTAIFQ